MIALAQRQTEMMASLLDDERSLPEGWGKRHAAGLDIYRNNYRTALVEALRSTFERTERLVGSESFERAAAHHLITCPPSSWTLDLAGQEFAETCGDLFANDPEVVELAWLEWSMHLAFVARDAEPLTGEEFVIAASGFGEEDWTGLRLNFVPGIALRQTAYDLKSLWSSLSEQTGQAELLTFEHAMTTVVWREGERPVFMALPSSEGAALAAMIDGATYGEVCETLLKNEGEAAIETAGTMLQRWLMEGLVEAIA